MAKLDSLYAVHRDVRQVHALLSREEQKQESYRTLRIKCLQAWLVIQQGVKKERAFTQRPTATSFIVPLAASGETPVGIVIIIVIPFHQHRHVVILLCLLCLPPPSGQ